MLKNVVKIKIFNFVQQGKITHVKMDQQTVMDIFNTYDKYGLHAVVDLPPVKKYEIKVLFMLSEEGEIVRFPSPKKQSEFLSVMDKAMLGLFQDKWWGAR